MEPNNLFTHLPDPSKAEIFEDLLKTSHFRVERITSQGQTTDSWFDQDTHEWVVLLKGKATLEFEQPPSLVTLNPGDYIQISAHVKHRVTWTDPNQKTVWLAIHFNEKED